MAHYIKIEYVYPIESLCLVRRAQAFALLTGASGNHQANDQSVQSQGLCEDQDEDHAHE
eukprot:CAMPEP_0178402064 /NCGR_PEP_ID=MMETSP0689_2-20121128/16643_1 /TAXON_ID=160604 /ORGANISM="Amphidinium massartii, Strain CS-259" /LENGTH=58 /DNA_ID=CAMNT_0020022941 /DNA_START=47 /DNA_END=220 /DNA_ORIENTATION=+